jgi:hypothetical protein
MWESLMPKPFDKWTVLPHDAIEIIDNNILAAEGPLGKFPRRMTIVRLTGQRLIIHSGIALDEAGMARIESFGEPSFYIAPSALHRMDVKPWKQRYPDIKIVCPPGARSKVEELVKVDTVAPDFGDPAVHYKVVDGTAQREGVLIVKGSQGTTLVLNDLIFNVRKQPGVIGLLFDVLGVTGPEAKMPKLVMRKLVHDKSALRVQLEQWANLSDLQRIILSHGAVIEADPGGTLRRFAASMA